MLTCCGQLMRVGKRDGYTVEAICPSCHHGLSPEQLQAVQRREMRERLGVLGSAINERNAELGIYGESGLIGKSLEEIIDGTHGLSGRSLKDTIRDVDGVALEDIFKEEV